MANIRTRTTSLMAWESRRRMLDVLPAVTLLLSLPVSSQGQECSDITTQNRSSVVHIQAEKTSKNTGAIRVFGGTGFVVAASGLVLTNKHVVDPEHDSDAIKISGAVGSQAATPQPMHWLADSETDDIAILQFNDTSKLWRPVGIGNPWQLNIGHPLCSMSFPLDIEFLIERGVVSGKGAPKGWWYSDMPSNPGDSGAPVFDASDGQVIAMQVGDRDDVKGLSYVIPINIAASLLATYAGVEVPHEHDRTDKAAATLYTNSQIDCVASDLPYARGFCSVAQCPNGQWVRGSAALLPSGNVVVKEGLETDRLDFGICGWVDFKLLDSSQSVLGYGYTQRQCIGAKSPLGNARIENLQPDIVKVPAPIANRVRSILTNSTCAGDHLAPLGIGGDAGPMRGSVSIVIEDSDKH